MGSRSGRYYCGIYEARPHDCREFTPIGCDDVDESTAAQGDVEDRAGVPTQAPRSGRATASGFSKRVLAPEVTLGASRLGARRVRPSAPPRR